MNISEEICKLVGMEPKYFNGYNKIPRTKEYTERYEYNHYDWQIAYPNLETPVNFVKVLDAITQNDYKITIDQNNVTIEGVLYNYQLDFYSRILKAIYEFFKEQIEEAEIDGNPFAYDDFKSSLKSCDFEY